VAYLLAQVPDNSKAFDYLSPEPFIALMALGFLIGIFGHIIQSKVAVATGIAIVFFSLLVLPLGVHLSR